MPFPFVAEAGLIATTMVLSAISTALQSLDRPRIINARERDSLAMDLFSGDAAVARYAGISTARPVICPAFSFA
jgi:hypothetical protein